MRKEIWERAPLVKYRTGRETSRRRGDFVFSGFKKRSGRRGCRRWQGAVRGRAYGRKPDWPNGEPISKWILPCLLKRGIRGGFTKPNNIGRTLAATGEADYSSAFRERVNLSKISDGRSGSLVSFNLTGGLLISSGFGVLGVLFLP